MKPIAEYKAGQHYLRADDLNAQLAELVRQGKLDVAGLLGLEQTPGGPALVGVDPEFGFWARIDGRSGTRYAWTEMRPAAGGTLEVKPLGRTGSVTLGSASEATLSQTVPTGTPVWMEKGYASVTSGGTLDQDWRFDYCCGGTGTVVSGSGSGTGDDLIVTEACPGGVPRTLVATFTDVGGNCACLDGVTVTLNYFGGSWTGTTTACSGKTIIVNLTPVTGGFSWFAGCEGSGGVASAGSPTSCSPFAFATGDFPGGDGFIGCCGVFATTLSVDITG